MPRRLLPALVVALVLAGAVVLAEMGSGFDTHPPPVHARAAEPQEPQEPPTDPPRQSDLSSETELPPDHPPIGRNPMAQTGSGEPQAITWKMPADWREEPNPNAVRLATYRTPGGAEMSVARAGGSTDANIKRWIGQFEDAGASTPEAKTVHGLRVTTVQIVGTYGAAMGMGPEAPEPHRDWALLGAVVEAPGSPYFFKLVGPAPAVKAARASFDRLMASLAPR